MNTTYVFLRLLNKRGVSYLKNSRPASILGNKKISTSLARPQLKIEKETFQDVWPNIVNTVVRDEKIAALPELAVWIKKVLDFNTDGGKKFRGMATVFAYECVEKPENITNETLELARILGWCVEILQSFFIVLDDIMDGSETRRGRTCWYKHPEVGLGLAINDSIFLQMSLHIALKKYFSDHRSYGRMVELFSDVLLYTSMGQHLDLSTSNNKKLDYSTFTMDRLNAIHKYKTAYYTFQLPVSLGLLLANITDRKVHGQIEDICMDLGKLFQMQDDYLDCFGEVSATGKIGTDIQEGKCTWFAVQALNRCDQMQKVIFSSCYGSGDPVNVESIRSLYKQLGLKELFYEEEKRITTLILEKNENLHVSTGVPKELITVVLDMLHERRR